MPHTPQQKKARYAALRAKLESLVGERCILCGCEDPDWHFHHPKGRTYDVRRINSYKRLKLYLEDFNNSNGQRLCSICNSEDGRSRVGYEDPPF